MSDAVEFVVTEDEAGRADRILAGRFPWASRRLLADLFERRRVRIDGKVARKGTIASGGQTIALGELPARQADLAPTPSGTLPIVYEDAHLVAVSKPAGMPSHPLRAAETGTAANALVAMFPETSGIGDDPREAGLVHRLDAGTSGLLVCARDRESWIALRAAFSSGRVEKQYLALVHGVARDGECDEPIGQSGKRVSVGSGLPAHTTWTVEAIGDGVALLRCIARTGRMHQIRAHLAHAGLPIVGDALYGSSPSEEQTGFFLHAETITLPHPATSTRLHISSPVPERFARALDSFGIRAPTS